MVVDHGRSRYARNRNFQVQSHLFGRIRGGETYGSAGQGHAIRQAGGRNSSSHCAAENFVAWAHERLHGGSGRYRRACGRVSRLDLRPKMKLLLDTHIWIWALYNPAKLNRAVLRELKKDTNELYLSPVSIWEARQLEKRKRLRLRRNFSEWLDEGLKLVRSERCHLRSQWRRRRRISLFLKPI